MASLAYTTGRRFAPLASVALFVTLMTGCVEREIVAHSEPSGALVMMNDQELGRTPASREFQWYGTYDVSVREEGYETLKTTSPVIAPPWLWFPFDFVTEILPITIHDTHQLTYTLQPTSDASADNASVIMRARALQTDLVTGSLTKVKPLTSSKSATQPAK